VLWLKGIESKPAGGGKVVLTRTCPFCRKEHSITVGQEDFARGKALAAGGALAQEAFPSWTPDEREFLISGVCPKCWDSL
jgi:hypothetical protein